MANIDYSNLAGLYRWLEFLVFSRTLQISRLSHLDHLLSILEKRNTSSSLAVVGDGDGRFLEELLKSRIDFRVNYIDSSAGMMRNAQNRIGSDYRINWHCGKFEESNNKAYDAIVCHFVLNGFDLEQRMAFIEAITERLKPEGILLVSDFDANAHMLGRILVFIMQIFFHLFAGVPFAPVILPDAALERAGMIQLKKEQWWRGAIFSQLWKM